MLEFYAFLLSTLSELSIILLEREALLKLFSVIETPLASGGSPTQAKYAGIDRRDKKLWR